MTTTHRRAGGALVAALALTAPFVVGLGSAAAAPRQPVEYDALGDSYASGYGVPPYEACGRSAASYAVQLDGRMRIDLDDNVACAGATTATLVAGGQLSALDGDTGVLLDESDSAKWTAAIEKLLFDTKARADLRSRGLARAHEKYAWPVVARAHLSFFEELLSSSIP